MTRKKMRLRRELEPGAVLLVWSPGVPMQRTTVQEFLNDHADSEDPDNQMLAMVCEGLSARDFAIVGDEDGAHTLVMLSVAAADAAIGGAPVALGDDHPWAGALRDVREWFASCARAGDGHAADYVTQCDAALAAGAAVQAGPYVFDASKLSREERESPLASVAATPGVHLEYARAADEGACAAALREVLALAADDDGSTLAVAVPRALWDSAKAALAAAPSRWARFGDAELARLVDSLRRAGNASGAQDDGVEPARERVALKREIAAELNRRCGAEVAAS